MAIAQAATQHQNRAASLLLAGEQKAACTELQKAAQLYRIEKDWVPYFSCLTQLTQAYLVINDLAEAKKTAKNALWQSINLLGRNNNEAARAAHQLALVYAAAGRFDDAMQYHSMGLDIRTDMHGQFHPAVSDSYAHIAGTQRDAGRLEQAQEYLTKALSILESTYRESHPETLPVLLEMGALYEAMGETANAKSMYSRAVAIQQKRGMASTDYWVPALVGLAKLSSPGKRRSYFKEAAALIEELDLSSGRAVGQTHLFLAEAAAAEGKFAVALNQGKAAVRALALLPASDTLVADALRLSARAAMMQGQAEAALGYYGRILQRETGRSEPSRLEAAEAALLAGRYKQAIHWSSPVSESGNNEKAWQAHLVKATAYLRLHQPKNAQSTIEAVDWRSSAPHFASRAYYLAAEAALAQRAYNEAGRYLADGLALATHTDAFTQLQLHATSGMRHVMLAEQDRSTLHNLQRSKTAFEQYQRVLANLLERRPLLPKELRWLERHHKAIYGRALESCFMLYQQQQEEQTIARAFRYTELAKELALRLEQSYWQPMRLARQLQYLSLSGVTETAPSYSKRLEAWREKAKAPMAVVSLEKFKSVLGEYKTQALSYFAGDECLYLLHLTPESHLLLRKEWTSEAEEDLIDIVQLETLGQSLPEGASATQFLLPLPAKLERWNKLLVCPTASMMAFPFAALPLNGQLLGESHELYKQISCSAFAVQCSQQQRWPSTDALRIGLLPDASDPSAGALALPTKSGAGTSCQPSLLSWIEQEGGRIMNLQQWKNGLPREVGTLALPEQDAARLIAALPEQDGLIRQLFLTVSASHSERPAALPYALSAWQAVGTQQIVIYPHRCKGDDAMQPALSGWEQTGDMAKALLALRRERPTNNDPAIWQMQVFGTPALTRKPSSSIPIEWILAVVGGLILLGWWVKR